MKRYFENVASAPRAFDANLLGALNYKKLPLFGKKVATERVCETNFSLGIILQWGVDLRVETNNMSNGVVLYPGTQNNFYNEANLETIKERILERKTEDNLGQDEVEFFGVLADEHSTITHMQVPTSLTGGEVYYITNNYIERQWFEDSIIPENLVYEVYWTSTGCRQINMPLYLKKLK